MRLISVLLLVCVLAISSGCASAKWLVGTPNPTVTLSAHKGPLGGGFKFKSDKEDTYHLEGLTHDPSTGAIGLAKLDIKHESVAVIKARQEYDVAVLLPARDKEIELQRQIGQNIALGIAVGGETGKKIIDAVLAPVSGAKVTVDTPIGKGTLETGKNQPSTQPAADPATPHENDTSLVPLPTAADRKRDFAFAEMQDDGRSLVRFK